ncbi:MAG: hypothetical protein ACYDED_00665 [Ferrimicrobium sp.]
MGGFGQVSDRAGEMGSNWADGHADDPAIIAARRLDHEMKALVLTLRRMHDVASESLPREQVSLEKPEYCEVCGVLRSQRPSQWTLGKCKVCYDLQIRRRIKRA